MQQELQTEKILTHLLEAGLTVMVPKIVGKSSTDMKFTSLRNFQDLNDTTKFVRSKWGIPEPNKAYMDETLPEWKIDTVIVPGVAFTKDCLRLGHGKGYYDNFLTRLQAQRREKELPSPKLIGVCFDCQVLDMVPTGPHDVTLNTVVTPTRVFQHNSDT